MGSPGKWPRRFASLALHLALVVILLAVFLHGLVGPLPEDNPRLQIVLGVGALAWLVATTLALRGYGSGRLVVAGAISLQLLALVGEPTLSDDIYRYVWEGELVADGVSPYAHAPDSPVLAERRAEMGIVYERMNHPDVSAAYPPVAQYTFATLVVASHWFRGEADPEATGLFAVLAMRVFFAACAVLVLVPLFLLLDRAGKPRSAALAWGWSPLVALEFAGSGHFDSLGIVLLFFGLALWTRPRHDKSSIDEGGAVFLLGLGALVKFLPGVALAFALRQRPRARLFGWSAFVLVVGSLPVLAFRERAAGLFDGLGAYGRTWEGGSLVHRWLDQGLRALPLPPDFDPQLTGRLVLAGLWLLCLAIAWRKRWEPVRASAFLIAAFLVLSPTLHPWYLTWIAAFLPLFPVFALRVWVAAAPLLYWPLARWVDEAVWVEPAWLGPAFSITVGALLLVGWLGHRLRARSEPQPAGLPAPAHGHPVAP